MHFKREFSIAYKNRGIVGIDLAGPQRESFSIEAHLPIFEEVRKAGLGITLHTGEEGNLDELRYVVEHIKPDRIGHGLLSVKDTEIMKAIREQNIVLETCITSNLRNRKVTNVEEMKQIIHTYLRENIPFTLNTDGPEMYKTNIHKEQLFAIEHGMLTEEQVATCTETAFSATFIK